MCASFGRNAKIIRVWPVRYKFLCIKSSNYYRNSKSTCGHQPKCGQFELFRKYFSRMIGTFLTWLYDSRWNTIFLCWFKVMFCGIHLSQKMFSEVLLIYYKFIVYSVHIICFCIMSTYFQCIYIVGRYIEKRKVVCTYL